MSRFPPKCAVCRERRVEPTTEDYRVTVDHDGRSYDLTIPNLELLKCRACGNRILPDAAGERINEALRQAAGLLSPAEIKEYRAALGLTQKELADRLRIAEATLSRWETGAQIQQRGYDILLRLFFDLAAVREHLSEPKPRSSGLENRKLQVSGPTSRRKKPDGSKNKKRA
jgi:putative zinc finger/helix-turn-helix YgiT family protein